MNSVGTFFTYTSVKIGFSTPTTLEFIATESVDGIFSRFLTIHDEQEKNRTFRLAKRIGCYIFADARLMVPKAENMSYRLLLSILGFLRIRFPVHSSTCLYSSLRT